MSEHTTTLRPLALGAAAFLALLASCQTGSGSSRPVAQPALGTSAQGGSGAGSDGARAGSAPAQAAADSAELVPLKNRLGLRGSYTNEGEADPWTQDGLELEADYGHRLTPNLEVGGVLGMITSDWYEVIDPDLYYLGPSSRFYFFDKGQLQPWLGGSLGFGDGNYQDSSFYFWRLGAGLSYFATSSVALEANLAYTGRSNSSWLQTEDDISDMTLRFGISWFF